MNANVLAIGTHSGRYIIRPGSEPASWDIQTRSGKWERLPFKATSRTQARNEFLSWLNKPAAQ